MEYKKFNNQYVIRIDKGEEICAKLKEVAQKENIKLAYLTGIGAAGKVTAGVFDTKEKVFKGHTWEFTYISSYYLNTFLFPAYFSIFCI